MYAFQGNTSSFSSYPVSTVHPFGGTYRKGIHYIYVNSQAESFNDQFLLGGARDHAAFRTFLATYSKALPPPDARAPARA
jgi:hypothetical protein